MKIIMSALSGLAGSICILASLWLIFELAGTPPFGETEFRGYGYGRVAFVGIVVVTSGVASVWFHRLSTRAPASRLMTRLQKVEGILFSMVGVILVVGGVLYLNLSGGFMGLHLIAFLLGGSLLVMGLKRPGARS